MNKLTEKLGSAQNAVHGFFLGIIMDIGFDSDGNPNLLGVILAPIYQLIVTIIYFIVIITLFLFPLIFIADTFLNEGSSIFTQIKCHMLTWLPFVDKCF